VKIDQIKKNGESWKAANLEATMLIHVQDIERSGITHVHVVGGGDYLTAELYDMIDRIPRFKPSELSGISK